jgi:FixJ family two-component response regulator/DNA-binding MarR family transcriptional regulator
MDFARDDRMRTSETVRVLLVDDDPDLLDELAEGLAFEGLSAMTASSAAEALTLLAQDTALEYVVTDIMMPGIGGFELLNKIAALKPRRRIVTVVMTGAATLEGAVSAIRYGVTDFLQKPVSASEIASALRRRGADSVVADDTRADEVATRSEILGALLSTRKERTKLFGEHIATEPFWDILLDLAFAKERGESLSTTSLCIGAGIPATTGLRRLEEMERLGLISRQTDPADRRRVMIALTAAGEAQMQKYVDRFSKRFVTLRSDERRKMESPP